jgi:hypothetical protein
MEAFAQEAAAPEKSRRRAEWPFFNLFNRCLGGRVHYLRRGGQWLPQKP